MLLIACHHTGPEEHNNLLGRTGSFSPHVHVTSLVQHLKVIKPVLCATSKFLAERLMAWPSSGLVPEVGSPPCFHQQRSWRLGQGKHGTEFYTGKGCTSQRRGAGPRKPPPPPPCPWQFCFGWHNLGSGKGTVLILFCAHLVVWV